MTNELVKNKTLENDITRKVMPIVYSLFVLLAVYYLFRANYMDAASNLGIALIFDPFNPKIQWQQRPVYQKAILFTHVFLVIVLFVYAFAI